MNFRRSALAGVSLRVGFHRERDFSEFASYSTAARRTTGPFQAQAHQRPTLVPCVGAWPRRTQIRRSCLRPDDGGRGTHLPSSSPPGTAASSPSLPRLLGRCFPLTGRRFPLPLPLVPGRFAVDVASSSSSLSSLRRSGFSTYFCAT